MKEMRRFLKVLDQRISDKPIFIKNLKISGVTLLVGVFIG